MNDSDTKMKYYGVTRKTEDNHRHLHMGYDMLLKHPVLLRSHFCQHTLKEGEYIYSISYRGCINC
jgi:hypothetical protein